MFVLNFVMIMQPKYKNLIKHVVGTVVCSKEFGDKILHAHAVMLDTSKRFAEVLFDETNLAKKIYTAVIIGDAHSMEINLESRGLHSFKGEVTADHNPGVAREYHFISQGWELAVFVMIL